MIYASDELQSIPTLFDALQTETVDALKERANLFSGSEQTRLVRKANLVEFIGQRMTGDHLQALWQRLDALQQAAVAETVHGSNPWFDADRFIAKYGQLPKWGEDRFYRSNPSLLGLFFFNGIMPEDLRQRCKAFAPKPELVRLSPLSEIPGEAVLIHEECDQKTRQKKTYRNMIPITCRLTERSGIHDLKAVLRLIDAGKLAVSDKTRQPGVTGLKAMNPLLLGGDFYDDSGYGDEEKIGPIKPFAWPMLMQGGGLILRVAAAPLAELLARMCKVAPLLGERLAEQVFRIRLGVRGLLKQALWEAGHRILIIGEFISQVEEFAAATGFPLLTGKTAQLERERLYQAFRDQTVPGLVLSRVGNFAVDLPDADVLIQVSGKYGSRQEEAQRLGWVLRPKKDGRRARFYTVVSLRTCEEDFARHRQLFLTEQGYSYQIEVRS